MSNNDKKQNSVEDAHSGNDYNEPGSISIPDELKSILSDPDFPKEKKQAIINAIVGVSIYQASTFSGPIPPPELLKGYNEVVSNGAERILSMAEKQSSHRMKIEDYAIKEELKQSRLGQLFGFALGLIGMILAAVLAIMGHEAIAGIFGTTTIIGLVTVFVLGKKAQQQNLSDK
jgi:uncharacterized membrane protein